MSSPAADPDEYRLEPSPTVAGPNPIAVPYSTPFIDEEEIAEVVHSLRTGFLTAGPKVRRFEEDFARYVGVKHAMAVSSCTAALTLALAALDIGAGDEVIVPTLTFCATANVVEHTGAKTVLVDVDRDLQIDPHAVARAISARTRAIVPVHYAGQACDLASIHSVAKASNLAVIEDAAHAAGAVYRGRKIGGCSLMTAFSFYPSKNMTTGEGGMLTTDNDETAARARLLGSHGRAPPLVNGSKRNSWEYEVSEPGYKTNMTDIQAAIGIHQLRRLDGFVKRRREIAQQYEAAFTTFSELHLPSDLPDRPSTYHLYTVRVAPNQCHLTRDKLMSALNDAGVGTSVHFIPLHRHPYYSNKYRYEVGSFPVADNLFGQIISLPLYPAMSNLEVHHVIASVRDAVISSRRI